MSMAVYPPGPASPGIDMQANGSLPVTPLYLPVPPLMICVPKFISGCDLSTSRVSNVEKILSPSVSANTHAPSMYFLSPDATLSAAQCADILSSIFSPFMFCVVPTASRLVAVPRPGMSMLMVGRKIKCVTYGVVPFFSIVCAPAAADTRTERTRHSELILTRIIGTSYRAAVLKPRRPLLQRLLAQCAHGAFAAPILRNKRSQISKQPIF